MEISLIVAIDQRQAIGYQNNLLCYLPNDLAHFKRTTVGATVIMGRRTYASLPNGPLPRRRNIVLSHTLSPVSTPEVEYFTSFAEALAACAPDEHLFVIGGGQLYAATLPLADTLYITYIHHTFEQADTYFPRIDTARWQEVERLPNPADERHPYAYDFVTYRRRS